MDTREIERDDGLASDLAFARLVLAISTELIDLDAASSDGGIARALETLGQFVGADRAYVFLLRSGGRVADNTHEWCARGIEAQAHRLQGFVLDEQFPRFASCMRQHRVYHVPSVRNLGREDAVERAEFEAEGIQSLVVVPMVRRASLSGFIGFDAVRGERSWSENDVALLRIVGHIIISVVERTRFELALLNSQDRFRSLVENTSDWVWEVNAQGEYTYVSPKVADLLGLEPAQVLGHTAFELMPEDEAERVRAHFELAAAAKRPIKALENMLRHVDGSSVWVETSGVPILGPAGELIGYRGIDRDITERKQAERERQELEQRLRETQKLESLGLLAGGIAHDFNNLLTAIVGQASLARLILSGGGSVLENLKLIEAAGARAAELTRQLLAYSGRAPLVHSAVSLSDVVEELRPLLEVAVSKSSLLQFRLADSMPAVACDVSQVRQILMNLVVNASEAAEAKGGGTIAVETGVVAYDPAEVTRTFVVDEMNGQQVAYLEVRDEGEGMPSEVAGRVFEPFFSTKSTGRGLGLAAVIGILKGHRGAISIRTSLGVGTSFRVLLPATAGGRRLDILAVPPETRRLQGRVLVVDDDDLVRSVAAATLSTCGLEVLEASDGAEALSLFSKEATTIDLVVLDMTMPGLSGEQVLEALRAIRPDVRVVVASGYAEDEIVSRFAEAPPDVFLQKPWVARQLIAAVTRAMPVVSRRAEGAA